MVEEVILVDINDTETGTMEKMQAHVQGALHRAISVFVFNSDGLLLLQRRAAEKYHSPGKWSNTCCTHPRPGEINKDAARRRLEEEMGIDCELIQQGTMLYRAEFNNGLIEHEFDHLFVGVADSLPQINPAEVDDYRYVKLETLMAEITSYPDHFTPWLIIGLEQIGLKTKEDENLA